MPMQQILWHKISISDRLNQRCLYFSVINGYFGQNHGFCIFLVTFEKFQNQMPASILNSVC